MPHFHSMLLFAMAIAFANHPIYEVFIDELLMTDPMSLPEHLEANIKFIGPPFFLNVLTDYDMLSTGDFYKMLIKATSGVKNYIPVVSSKKLNRRYAANRAAYYRNNTVRAQRVVRRVKLMVAHEEQKQQQQQQEECCICLDAPSTVVFQPCGHTSACADCSLDLKVCMLCRTAIKGRKTIAPSAPREITVDDDDDDDHYVAPYQQPKNINPKIKKSKRGRRCKR
jgi:hypothetical protein